MFLHEITIRNLLSFGTDSKPFALRPLNVLIGPNGSGKSNLLEIIGLLQAAPKDLSEPILEGGGALEWLHKYSSLTKNQSASIVATVRIAGGGSTVDFRHDLRFAQLMNNLFVDNESVTFERKENGQVESHIETRSNVLHPIEGRHPKLIEVNRQMVDESISMLALIREPVRHPATTGVGNFYRSIKIYREWSFGRRSSIRMPQSASARSEFLEENCSNLGLVLNGLRRHPVAKQTILDHLQDIYADITDYDVQVYGGSVQVYLEEGKVTIPATRLSDGTLRYLCLLAILCHPNPPPLICIEEPELGLHPDVLPRLGKLIKEASERTQLIITTHSDILLDAFRQEPEDVVVTEKHDGQTVFKRLDGDKLAVWLEKYSLSNLWSSGQLGGNRW